MKDIERDNSSYRPDASVIVAVYNHFEWLRLILDALRMQTYKNFEVIIADDGSDAATVGKIKEYISNHPSLKIIHSWHEDKGWRKNIALNEAVRKASADYLIFVDGDCVPHPKFVADHLKLSKKGRVIGGRRVESEQPLSDMVAAWNELPERYFSKARCKILKNIFSTPFGKTMFQLRRTVRLPFFFGKPLFIREQGFLGANFSIFKSDIEKVNGFDERYLDPGTGEDSDIDLRLEHAGIKHYVVPHYALMIHRHHPRLFLGSENNKRLYKEAFDNKTTYIATGLHKNK